MRMFARFFMFALLAVAPAHAESGLERVIATGTLRCGYTTAPPFIIKDPNTGALSGLQYDIINEMAHRMDLKADWAVESTFGNAVADLQAGKYDVFCAGLTPTAVRGKFVSFTEAPFYSPWYAWVRADDDRFTVPADLNHENVRMAMVTGTSLVSMHKQLFPRSQAQDIESLGTFSSDLLLSLAAKKVDFIVLDRETVENFMKTNQAKFRRLSEEPTWVVPYSFALSKADTGLRDAMNTALAEMKNSGGLAAILESHKAQVPYIMPPVLDYRP